ncbi:hypothetical protein GETHLI_21260 [Geothrix limicola]|uniref:SnoaL-like domain-containing protein n=1 Tax=Geothrix limicola TaxID=2927978 RepID=A0ABQ5QGA3_9BACT|nr:nuclear transport factor 2 family protein [Geothrix limicola]GLH73624.1 hypothetical protein GETHLI_21260 [Geothrix limicola]
MKPHRLLALPALAFLVSCHPGPESTPFPADENTQTVQGFLRAYGRRDLEGMMGYLDDEATFVGTGVPLNKAQIRDFFQATFRKHPNLRVEVRALRVVQGRVHADVRVETDTAWADTWIFELRNRRIHRYSLASGTRTR